MVGLWTEICVAVPAIQATGEGRELTTATAFEPAFAKILLEHAGGSGVALGWEQQLLHSAKSAAA